MPRPPCGELRVLARCSRRLSANGGPRRSPAQQARPRACTRARDAQLVPTLSRFEASATAHCSPLRGLLLGPAALCCSPSARFAVRLLPASQSLLGCHASPMRHARLPFDSGWCPGRFAPFPSPSLRSIPAAHDGSALLGCHASPAHDAVLSRSDCTSRPAGLRPFGPFVPLRVLARCSRRLSASP